MRSKLLVLVLAVAVSAGFALSGCKGGGGGVAEMCKKMAAAQVEAEKVPAADAQKAAAEEEKSCMDDFNKFPADKKEQATKAADEVLKTCGDKKGEELMKCAVPILNQVKM